jgi:hypothetical protein
LVQSQPPEEFGENVPFTLPFQKAENDLYPDR